MELFYGQRTAHDEVYLDADESIHLVKVMRHKAGDVIYVTDGKGTVMKCDILDASPKGSTARIVEEDHNFGKHPYSLTLAVSPTKNNERYEWMGEKTTEFGVDTIVPVIGERSERKIYKTERLRKVVLSAAKQSLKSELPAVEEPVSVLDFIKNAPDNALKLIAYCFEGEKVSIKQALEAYPGNNIIIMIGPEGDFSPKEVAEAIRKGFKPVHLGTSRLRTETAAICAASSVYYKYL